MFRYVGKVDELHKIYDSDSNRLDFVDTKSLKRALTLGVEIEGACLDGRKLVIQQSNSTKVIKAAMLCNCSSPFRYKRTKRSLRIIGFDYSAPLNGRYYIPDDVTNIDVPLKPDSNGYLAVFGGRGLKNYIYKYKGMYGVSEFSIFHDARFLDLSFLDVSQAKDMHCMFRKCNFTSLKLGDFECFNVIDMHNMFYECNLLIESAFRTDAENSNSISDLLKTCPRGILDLRDIKAFCVKDISAMFRNCRLDTVYLPDFSSGSLERMSSLFKNATIKGGVLDLSSFNVENVKNMRGVFEELYDVNSINFGNFNCHNTTTMTEMFHDMVTDKLDLSSFDLSSIKYTNMMFNRAVINVLDIRNFDLQKCQDNTFDRAQIKKLIIGKNQIDYINNFIGMPLPNEVICV